MKNWSTGDKIGFYSVLIAIIAIIISVATPEIRNFIGLDENKDAPVNFPNKLSDKDIAYILIARAIQEGTLDQDEVDRLIATLNDQNATKIIDSLHFIDQTVYGIVNKGDIDKLFDKKIKGGFTPPEPLELECDGKILYVNTCREYFKIPNNCGPTNGFMEKEFHWYDISCTILKAIKEGVKAKKSYIPNNLLEELPQSFINTHFAEEEESMERLFSTDKRKIGVLGLKQVDNSIEFREGDEFICNLTELMRTDINGDGYEDVLVNKWFWTGGTMTTSELWWLTRRETQGFAILNIN